MKKMMIALLFTFIFPGKIAQARHYDAPETAVSFFSLKETLMLISMNINNIQNIGQIFHFNIRAMDL